MPIMPMIGVVSFFISYWVDKFLFCNFYCTPPMYSDEMGRTCTSLVGLLVVVHLGMSMWMIGSEGIFKGERVSTDEYSQEFEGVPQDTTFMEKISKRHLFPIQAVLVMYVSGVLISQLSATFLRKMCGFLKCLTCSTGGKAKNLKRNMNMVPTDYSSAREREIIKGISSYNILQNPK